MIKGKYLRERKALRTKRRIKLLICLVIIYILYKIIFGSFSIYKSEANSEADIDIAFYLLKDEYIPSKVIKLDDMLPGDSQIIKFSIANFEDVKDEDGSEKRNITETDMDYKLKIRTTTNLPLKYSLYIDQDVDAIPLESLNDVLGGMENIHEDEYNTFFNRLVKQNEAQELKDDGITDTYQFSYTEATKKLYTLNIEFPAEYANDYRYQNIIECVEIAIDSHQIITGDDSEETDIENDDELQSGNLDGN